MFLHALEIFVLCLNAYHDRAGHQDMSRRHGGAGGYNAYQEQRDEGGDEEGGSYHHPQRGTAGPPGPAVVDGGYGARATGSREGDSQRLLRPLSPSGMRRQRSFTEFL